MKVLIVGFGSIAQKHMHALKQLVPDTKILALRNSMQSIRYEGVKDLHSITEIPGDIDFAIISNPTSEHARTIEMLLPLRKPLFIEKPVFHELAGLESLVRETQAADVYTYVACNLRFHPVIQFLKKKFEQKRPLEYVSYCGSYLPNWRPNTDYRKNYSAIKMLGGGVRLDLIHELDFCCYLMGKPTKIHGERAKISRLEIETEDIAHYTLSYPNTFATITLNYYRPEARRDIELVWEDVIWKADLLQAEVRESSGELIFQPEFEPMDSYLNQMNYFLECVKGNKRPMNDITEAWDILKLCLQDA
ncbi:MAG: Gfo/Idh/MocA family oxidoreductase [Candidatus Levybacteria bacterium]|nr:Gfo/Idh/MocA family oxidoreductase [Candidatus Levybacteria bacterium]